MTAVVPFETAQDATTFIKGGRAMFTLKSLASGTHYTYKVQQKKNKETGEFDGLYFVNVLVGNDNTDYTHFMYIGFVPENGLKLVAGKKGRAELPSFQALSWALGHLAQDTMPAQLSVQHEGRCCRCNRTLTHPDSLTDGIGPECKKR